MALQKTQLEDCLALGDEKGKSFAAGTFFDRWFRYHGTAYLFIFKKNFRVTNIQFAELRALIETHLESTEPQRPSTRPQFFLYRDFRKGLLSLVDTFPQDESPPLNRYSQLTSLYGDLLEQIVVVEPLFGCCAVFVPPGRSLNLLSICADSGYIHTAGRLVYLRKLDQATYQDLHGHLERHLATDPTSPKKPFIVYCHEDFSEYDRESLRERRDGIEDLKIHLEKCYLGEVPLVEILEDLAEDFVDRISVLEAGHYGARKSVPPAESESCRASTIWLLNDFDLGRGPRERGDDVYLLCYEQEVVNCNPFQLFDENKPAWIAHTTIPHTLMGAMLNITRPGWPKDRPVIVADPFVGSGTTLLEVLKFPNARPACGDIDPIAPLLVADNLAVIGSTPRELEKLLEYLHALLPSATSDQATEGTRMRRTHAGPPEWAARLIDELDTDAISELETAWKHVCSELPQRTLKERLAFYCALRVARRHAAAIAHASRSKQVAFRRETEDLCYQIRSLAALRRRATLKRGEGRVTVLAAHYSCAVTLDPKFLRPAKVPDLTNAVAVQNALDLPKSSYDVVIADPPYGFNTNEDLEKLASLYASVAKPMVDSLMPGGQLVICLPEVARTGRKVPFFATKDIVLRQVLMASESAGRRVGGLSSGVGLVATLTNPPYYWESERALRRNILHFRIE